MKLAVCKLKGVSPYSQSKHVTVEKRPKESADDYERRTWRERMHVSPEGLVQIPPMAFAGSIKEAAKYLSIQIPGQGKATFTKNFEAGVMVTDFLTLPVRAADVEGEWVFVPANGVAGAGKRVNKCFPRILEWEGVVPYYILDDIITLDVFEQVLKASGNLIGIGRFRPRNRGYYGRFIVEEIDWDDDWQQGM